VLLDCESGPFRLSGAGPFARKQRGAQIILHDF